MERSGLERVGNQVLHRKTRRKDSKRMVAMQGGGNAVNAVIGVIGGNERVRNRRMRMTIREEIDADFAEIAEITRAAFGGEYEVGLIEKLRGARLVALSLVAVEEGSAIGHVLFSELQVEVNGRKVKTVALAPVAVRPDRQRLGIGSKLIESGLKFVRNRGYEAVIVLGHPNFYPRFGFSAALTASLNAPFSGKAFMGLELAPGSLSGNNGSVIYPDAFGV